MEPSHPARSLRFSGEKAGRTRGEMTDDDDDDFDEKVAQTLRKIDDYEKTMESDASDEEIDHDLKAEARVVGASSQVPSKKMARFKWHYAVQSHGARGRVTHPFLNDRNTADLLLCVTLLALQPWKRVHGKMKEVQLKFVEACTKAAGVCRTYPLQLLRKWGTVKLRMAEYDKLKMHIQDKTGPSTGDVELDELLQKDDLMSETSRVSVMLWRALLEVFDAREEYSSLTN
jgi:hypothetical protein